MIPYYELRIGNYVLVENQLQRISMINNERSLTNVSSIATEEETEDEGKQTFASIEPVPLTDEVLQQCHFVYHDYFKFWQLLTGTGTQPSEMDIDRDYNILDFMRKPIVKEVSSLHQLQNIFFILKGKELNFHKSALQTSKGLQLQTADR